MNAESLKMPKEEFEAYTSGNQVPPLNAMNMGCNQAMRTMENSLIQVQQLLERQKSLKEHINELEMRVKRETDELSVEVDQILDTYPSGELKHLTEQIINEELVHLKSLSISSSQSANALLSSQDVDGSDENNTGTEDYEDYETDVTTSESSSVQNL